MNNPDKLLAEMRKRIAARRKTLRLSQDEWAEKADVTPQMLSTAERGTKAIRPENLLKISAALGVSADYLLTGDIIDKDLSLLKEKLKSVSSEQFRSIEKVIDHCIDLCKQ